jgi:hypothetical protein
MGMALDNKGNGWEFKKEKGKGRETKRNIFSISLDLTLAR